MSSTADLSLQPIYKQYHNFAGQPVVNIMIVTILILAAMTALVSIDSDITSG